jgi:hypothetical protein
MGQEPSADKGQSSRTRKRAKNYPYDKPTSYGGPRSIDANGSAYQDVSQTHTRPMLPMDLRHGPWDEETGELEQEASSYPGLLSKASDTGMGGTIPGTAGGWAGSYKTWDAEDAVERAGSRPLKRESAWGRLAEGLEIIAPMGDGGLDAMGLELDAQRAAFRDSFAETLPVVDRMDAPSLVALLMDLDPEYAAETLAPDDEAEAQDMYRRWGSYALGEEQR